MKWFSKDIYRKILLVAYLALFIWSAVNPKDYNVWLLEIIGVVFIVAVYLFFDQRIRFSGLTNTWFFIGACLITIGAHYSFPNVPLFDYLKDISGADRNDYDKLGHLVQGVLPVLISWEVLVKEKVATKRSWINFLSVNIALSVSALYELFEWLFVVIFGNNSYTSDVLGTQGYIWDSQSDMLCALIGALLTVIIGRKFLQRLIFRYQTSDQATR
ncbi:MAG TPA: DUF2238 domain-containing protein [Bacteroidales bacterium]|nr:DUF2238 domain-containing protein [Bacteroidales bacterium]